MLLVILLGFEVTTLASGPTPKRSPSSPYEDHEHFPCSDPPLHIQQLFAGVSSKGIYVVVDTAQNTVYVREGENPLYCRRIDRQWCQPEGSQKSHKRVGL